MSKLDQHFATLIGSDLAEVIREKSSRFIDDLDASGDLERMRLANMAYYGEDEHGHTTAKPDKVGEKDEARILKVNEFRNVLNNKVTIVTADPPALMPVPSNTDEKSQGAQQLGKGLLDYYMDEKRVDPECVEGVEAGEIHGWAWNDVRWDRDAGAELAADSFDPASRMVVGEDGRPQMGEDGQPMLRPVPREGDVRVDVRLAPDVAFDFRRRNKQRDWVIIRTWENKYDLAAKVESAAAGDMEASESAAEIRGLGPPVFPKELAFLWPDGTEPDSDDVEVLELRHLPTPACPGGKLVRLVGEVFLEQGPLPYKDLSCYAYEAGRRFGTPRAYTSAHDGLGLQVAIDGMASLIYSALRVTGVPPLYAREGAGLRGVVMRGLRILYGKHPEPPVPLAMPQPTDGVYKFLEGLTARMGNLQGMDNLSMGREDRDLSGAAMALLDTRTQRAVSKAAKAYLNLRKDVAGAILRILADEKLAAGTRKVTLLAGKSRAPMLREYTAADLAPIDRVTLKTVSPMSKTPAGRVTMAQDLLAAKAQGGQPLINAQQYMGVVETGELEPLTEAPMANMMRIRRENEMLADGKPVLPALWTDPHDVELKEHAAVLNSDEVRGNPQVFQNVAGHMLSHLDQWRNADPAILAALGIPPPPMPMMMPPPDASGTPPPKGGEPSGTKPPAAGKPTASMPPDGSAGMPSMPQNPSTGEKYEPTGALPGA
jgi:hypothetical protein